MGEINVLDCTLRDGGYCNNWDFGLKNIKKIVNGLVEANIDIIECGYISQKQERNQNRSQYSSFEDIEAVMPADRDNKMFVAMINYGDFKIDDIPDYNEKLVDGIRVCFKKNDRFKALDFCKKLKEKGYKVFIQGMVSMSFSDDEFIDFIKRVNEFEPFAFYIVDSFGTIKAKDLIRLFYLVEHNLKETIKIGFHSHNNMQLAYSNCLTLAQIQTNRTIIIDSSIYGMGRGAGNLNTELFIEYLNENKSTHYVLKPLLSIIDDILDAFYQNNYWGYSLPNYISAKNNAHPNYAGFLNDKKTLTVEDMDNIFQLMSDDKKIVFDKNYIEELYTKYLASEKVQEEHKDDIRTALSDKTIILVAPGKSSAEEFEAIKEKLNKDTTVCIAVNFDYELADYIFLSNLRRYKEIDASKRNKCIVTSNIYGDGVYLQTKYKPLLNTIEFVKDNAGLMAIKFLEKNGAKEVLLAGFDGYSHDTKDNYANGNMELIIKNVVFDEINKGMETALRELSRKINISFLTKPRFVRI